MVKDLLYPLLQAHNPIFTSQQALFTVFNAANSSGENKREKQLQNGTKMRKMDPHWGYPNGVPQWVLFLPVYPILQAKKSLYNQFLLISSAPRRLSSVFRPQGCSGRGCQHLTHPPMCSLHLCGHFDTKFTIIRQF